MGLVCLSNGFTYNTRGATQLDFDRQTIEVRSLASKLKFFGGFKKTLGRIGETHYNLRPDLVTDHPTSASVRKPL